MENRFKTICILVFISSTIIYSQSLHKPFIFQNYDAKMIPIDSLHLKIKEAEPYIDLDPAQDSLRVIFVDLNNDGFDEHILLSVCGSGGCVNTIFDGISNSDIGTIFGQPTVVSDKIINGWPVLIAYSHQSAASGVLSTYVFDGKKYITVSSVMLYDKSVDEYFDLIKKWYNPQINRTP
jgi:hypothetical protein